MPKSNTKFDDQPRSPDKANRNPTSRSGLSVIIITRNEEKNIESCINSVLDATRELPTEVILVDSGSEDSTLEIADQFELQFFCLPPGRSASAANGRSVGARYCRGRYIQFVDGDMTVDPLWMHRALSYFGTADAAIAAVAGKIRQNPTQTAAREYQRRNLEKMTRTPKAMELGSLYGAFMIKASVLEELGSFNSRLKALEEAELSDRIRAAGHRIVLLPHLMCHHHVEEGEGLVQCITSARIAARSGGEVFRKAIGTSSFMFRLRQFKSCFAAAAFVLYGLAALVSAIVFHSGWWGLSWGFALLLLYSLFVVREKGKLQHALYFLTLFLTTWVFFFYGFIQMPYDKTKHPDPEPAQSAGDGR